MVLIGRRLRLKEKDEKRELGQILGIFIFIIICAYSIYLIGYINGLKIIAIIDQGKFINFLVIAYISLMLSFYLHIIIHEGGALYFWKAYWI